jgi:hypothetical protein
MTRVLGFSLRGAYTYQTTTEEIPQGAIDAYALSVDDALEIGALEDIAVSDADIAWLEGTETMMRSPVPNP